MTSTSAQASAAVSLPSTWLKHPARIPQAITGTLMATTTATLTKLMATSALNSTSWRPTNGSFRVPLILVIAPQAKDSIQIATKGVTARSTTQEILPTVTMVLVTTSRSTLIRSSM